MTRVPASLLAVCEGTSASEQALGVLFALVVLAVWAGFAWLCIWMERTPAERLGLGLVAVGSAIAGSLVLLCFHDDLAVLLIASAAIAAAIGLAAALYTRRFAVLPAVGAALLGDLLLPVVVLTALILHVSLGSGCLGDELG
ncbi:MAG TPA: hypothetical protein VFX35_02390 [Solirubrobacterales bacterium]|nr:hypothetical protein [Solirubrobacterales bacterium]